jgi:hypothetical protein
MINCLYSYLLNQKFVIKKFNGNYTVFNPTPKYLIIHIILTQFFYTQTIYMDGIILYTVTEGKTVYMRRIHKISSV